MAKSPITVRIEHRYRGYVMKKYKKKVRKKVNGRYVTRYVTATKKVLQNKVRRADLPVTPEQVMANRTKSFTDIQTVSKREYTRSGANNGRVLRFEGFLPSNPRSYMQSSKFENNVSRARWYDERMREGDVLQVIISAMGINYEYQIRSFEWGFKDGTKDIYYTMELKEHWRPALKTGKI